MILNLDLTCVVTFFIFFSKFSLKKYSLRAFDYHLAHFATDAGLRVSKWVGLNFTPASAAHLTGDPSATQVNKKKTSTTVSLLFLVLVTPRGYFLFPNGCAAHESNTGLKTLMKKAAEFV